MNPWGKGGQSLYHCAGGTDIHKGDTFMCNYSIKSWHMESCPPGESGRGRVGRWGWRGSLPHWWTTVFGQFDVGQWPLAAKRVELYCSCSPCCLPFQGGTITGSLITMRTIVTFSPSYKHTFKFIRWLTEGFDRLPSGSLIYWVKRKTTIYY